MSATVSLYDKLRVVEEAPSYIVKSLPPADLNKIGVGTPEYGGINTLEPLLAGIREGSLPDTKIQDILTTLGLTVNGSELECGNGTVSFER